MKAGIIGLGTYMPDRVMTNADFEKIVDTTDEWIVSRSGIRERRFASPDQACSDISSIAAQRAIKDAGLKPEDIDMFIVATASPDMLFPSTSCLVTEKLGFKGLEGPGAMDIAAGCTGFIYGLVTAKAYVESGLAKNVCVIGAEVLSKLLDMTDRATCVLFGDGAGAAIVGAVDGNGIMSTMLKSSGEGSCHITLPGGGSRNPATHQTIDNHDHFVHMNGSDVFKFAVRAMDMGCEKVLEKAGLKPEDIDIFIPHQANLRIIESAAKRMKLPMDKVMVTLDKTGNTSAASIPIAMDIARSEGKLKKGDKLLAVAFGAGLTWGSVVIEW
jgi:3-oxoacyl-[acyl-carrier-protein] synthase-3